MLGLDALISKFKVTITHKNKVVTFRVTLGDKVLCEDSIDMKEVMADEG